MDESLRHVIEDFVSPTTGRLAGDGLFREIIDYVREDPSREYNLIIGTDSFLSDETVFVSAVIVHRVGHGGRYFYKKSRRRKITNLKQRIFHETTLSIELATAVREGLSTNGFKLDGIPFEVHLDVGMDGETKEIVKQVVGMVRGSGYEAVTKPGAYGASKVADRHSR